MTSESGAPDIVIDDTTSSARDLAILAQVGRSLLGTIDLDDQLGLTLRLAVSALGADRGSIMLWDAESKTLTVGSAEGLPMAAMQTSIQSGEGIAGWVAAHREPLVLHGDVADPRFTGNDPSIDSSLSLPLLVQDTLLGVLNIVRRSGAKFTERDLHLASSLADMASIAIEKSRLHTALKEREGRVSELLAAAIGAQEKERTRIAADIHDGFLQDLSALFLKAESVRMLLRRGEPQAADAEVESLQEMMRDEVKALRDYIFEVRPPSLDEVGLIPTIEAMLGRISSDNAIVTALDAEDFDRLPESIETVLYRTAQEALRNVVKHAHATKVTVTLTRQGSGVTMAVIDDGKGIEAHALEVKRRQHFGIATMQERVEMAGGEFQVSRRAEGGTEVRALIPLSAV